MAELTEEERKNFEKKLGELANAKMELNSAYERYNQDVKKNENSLNGIGYFNSDKAKREINEASQDTINSKKRNISYERELEFLNHVRPVNESHNDYIRSDIKFVSEKSDDFTSIYAKMMSEFGSNELFASEIRTIGGKNFADQFDHYSELAKTSDGKEFYREREKTEEEIRRFDEQKSAKDNTYDGSLTVEFNRLQRRNQEYYMTQYIHPENTENWVNDINDDYSKMKELDSEYVKLENEISSSYFPIVLKQQMLDYIYRIKQIEDRQNKRSEENEINSESNNEKKSNETEKTEEKGFTTRSYLDSRLEEILANSKRINNDIDKENDNKNEAQESKEETQQYAKPIEQKNEISASEFKSQVEQTILGTVRDSEYNDARNESQKDFEELQNPNKTINIQTNNERTQEER